MAETPSSPAEPTSPVEPASPVEPVETSPRATVAILTYNGETYLRRILEAVSAQRLDGGFEILVIDSGSTDATLEIVAEFPSVRLHKIPNTEFGHGRTRNLAAQLARGEFVAYLTHDAVPLHDRWLAELVEPFTDQRVVAVMGKQVPRASAPPLLKYEIVGTFAQFGPDFGTTVFSRESRPEGVPEDAVTFYSDVNSAARRRFLTEVLPYRDVQYAEDQLFGRDLIAAGHRKAYAPRAAVEHSNDLTLAEYAPRMFDETLGLRRSGMSPSRPSRIPLRLLRGVVADSVRILRDRDYGLARTLYWLVVNPAFHVQKWAGIRKAWSVDVTDAAAIRAASLEARRSER